MNMPDDLVIDFFTRTIKNLKLYDKYCKEESTKKEFEYEVTQLVNSFLGLIVFIVEKSKKDLTINVKNDYKGELIMREMLLSEITTNAPFGFSEKIYDYVKDKIHSTYQNDKNTQRFLEHLRNSISHCKIKMRPDGKNSKEIGSIFFRDELKTNNGVVKAEFEITLTLEDIRKIIKLIENEITKS